MGHGMPLRGDDETASLLRTHGDLVVKFPIVLPRAPRRLALRANTGGLAMPPLLLLTSRQAMARTSTPSPLPVDALHTVLKSTLLPAVLAFVARKRVAAAAAAVARVADSRVKLDVEAAIEAGADLAIATAAANANALDDALAANSAKLHAPTHPNLAANSSKLYAADAAAISTWPSPCSGLVAVCLVVDGLGRVPRLSRASRQFMRGCASMLPQLRWRVRHLAGDGIGNLAEPLLHDEIDEIAHACIVLLQADADPADAAAAAAALLPRRARKVALVGYEVCWSPGVRVRLRPALDAPTVRVLRCGDRFQGSSVLRRGWIALPDSGYVLHDATASVGSRRASGGGGADSTGHGTGDGGSVKAGSTSSNPGSSGGRRSVPLVRRLDEGMAWAGESEDESGSDEDTLSEKERRTLDVQYMAGGLDHARRLMGHPAAQEALMGCHTSGGVLVAIDGACTLLGQPPPRLVAKGRATSAGRGGGARGTPRPLESPVEAWPHLLPYLVSPSPPATTPADGGADSVGVDDVAQPSWRRLRRALVQSGASDCVHGFGALGLPAGAVVTALSDQRGAVRTTCAALRCLWTAFPCHPTPFSATAFATLFTPMPRATGACGARLGAASQARRRKG